ncbi:IS66 family transposase [Ketobacter sp.]|uniref:IS66 family transposase n=1 Tax=Ketobacter sp. TaxID=2083498 RepID=UPI0025BB4F1E|nr:IS66 family transposase [Ketobacter sp.]
MSNVADLHQENEQLKAQLQAKEHQLSSQQHYIKQLEEALLKARQQRFGMSSEKQSPDQVALFNEAECDSAESDEVTEVESTTTVKSHTRNKRSRIAIPNDIERENITYDLVESEKVCPHDGSALKPIGEEIHEQLDIIPAQLKAIRHIRKKYACPCCEHYVVTAKKPKQPIEKSIASPGLLAYIATNKYCDALPLYRQTELFKRIGIELNRTQMANWMIKAGELIQPLINLIQEHIRQQSVMHLDETTVQVLKEPDKTAQSKSHMWVMSSYRHHPAIVFHYAPSRSGSVAETFLQGTQPNTAIMVDGYEGYQKACDRLRLKRLGCWAHARRLV